MRQYKMFRIILLLLLCLITAPLKAEVWTPDNLPMVHLQDSTRFVCNPDGVMSDEAVRSTDRILARLKQEKGVETVVVAVRRIDGGDAYRFGMDLGRKYGIGDKEQNSGLIIVLSTEDRVYQFLTGQGLEGTLPDAICRRIQNRVMVPALKKGDWDGAIYESVKAIEGYVMGDETLQRKYRKTEDDGAVLGLVICFSLFILFLLIFRIRNKARRNCPRCKGKGSLMLVKTRRSRVGNQWRTQNIWRCSHCGHTEIDDTDEPTHFGSGGMFVPPIIMGGHTSRWGGGSWGGGFGGGSFGGGSFGGGGSGGRF